MIIALFLGAVAALGVGVWRYGYVQALDGLAERGAAIVAADIGGIEWNWTGSGPPVFFVVGRGKGFITNRSELTCWRRPAAGPGLVPPDRSLRGVEARQVGRHAI